MHSANVPARPRPCPHPPPCGSAGTPLCRLMRQWVSKRERERERERVGKRGGNRTQANTHTTAGDIRRQQAYPTHTTTHKHPTFRPPSPQEANPPPHPPTTHACIQRSLATTTKRHRVSRRYRRRGRLTSPTDPVRTPPWTFKRRGGGRYMVSRSCRRRGPHASPPHRRPPAANKEDLARSRP